MVADVRSIEPATVRSSERPSMSGCLASVAIDVLGSSTICALMMSRTGPAVPPIRSTSGSNSADECPAAMRTMTRVRAAGTVGGAAVDNTTAAQRTASPWRTIVAALRIESSMTPANVEQAL